MELVNSNTTLSEKTSLPSQINHIINQISTLINIQLQASIKFYYFLQLFNSKLNFLLISSDYFHLFLILHPQGISATCPMDSFSLNAENSDLTDLLLSDNGNHHYKLPTAFHCKYCKFIGDLSYAFLQITRFSKIKFLV